VLTVRRAVQSSCVAFVLVLGAGATAFADTAVPVDCSKSPTDPQCIVTVTDPGTPGGSGSSGRSACHDPGGVVVPCQFDGGWLADDGCYYKLATGLDLAGAVALSGPATPPMQWYVGACGYPPVAGLTKYRLFGAPPGPAVLADQAVRALRLPVPVIRLNPPAPAPQLVNLPMWVWLDPGSWGSRSATASVPGLSVTATAVAVGLTLRTSDGASMSCTGPGTAWSTGTDPRAPSPTCGHTFTTAGAVTVSVTVTWNVSWVGGGTSGTVPALASTSTVATQVRESAGLNSGGTG